jgi:hypothetical protein
VFNNILNGELITTIMETFEVKVKSDSSLNKLKKRLVEELIFKVGSLLRLSGPENASSSCLFNETMG